MGVTGTRSASNSTSSGVATTAAIDSTGANLIVACTVSFQNQPTPSDSAGNAAPTKFVSVIDNVNNRNQSALWIWENPTTSATHTFSATLSFGCIAVAVISGATVPSTDQSNSAVNAGNGATTTCTAGSVTPGQNNEILVTFFGMDDPTDASTPTINGSFIEQQFINSVSGALFGCYLATWVQTTATTINPTITRPAATLSGRTVTGVVATFKATAPASQVVFRRTLSPIGTRAGSRQVHNRWRRSSRGGLLLRDPLILPEAA
jgi:hypothetical protein